ncbi:serine/threonine-protein kinase [Limnoglobus roseus]|uniref:serine/threonine-protein kinase n=1 Tax=Limnoglobus roseus TaxID=2598579 RepID=UPI00143DBDAC|nr:serine/threonine-protein kinase [Limnoglobus roseus]
MTVSKTPTQAFDAGRFDQRDVSPQFRARGFEVIRELGRGGMGVVYKARHVLTGEVVALKTLQQMTPAGLLRFKREFRIAANLSHPNLVSLRELVSDGTNWFLTMELVDGGNFLAPDGAFIPTGPAGGDADARLRDQFRQLAFGLAALHAAGILHRDVKPRNVLVTAAGRVVLVDFGLAGEVAEDGHYLSAPGQVTGTVAYMAPEQAIGGALTTAADWYAFGIVLYKALSGDLPYTGTVAEILWAKQRTDPPTHPLRRADLPPDLVSLCLDLLARDPADRPSAEDVVRRLSTPASAADGRGSRQRTELPTRGVSVVGRERHLRSLDDAFAAVRAGRTGCVRVHGPSGAGKSTLIRTFLQRLPADTAITLFGRCYEQELVPFKAFDGVVDSLTQYLVDLPEAQVAALLPRDARALARLFPVFGRAIAVAAVPRGVRDDALDQREVRRRGIAAIRDLFGRLGDRRPVVLCIDDLQWSDADSLIVLEELLRPPDPPRVLILLTYREEDAAGSPILHRVKAFQSVEPTVVVTDLQVAGLSPDEATALVTELLGETGGDRALAIVREAGGNPFYLGELAEAIHDGVTVDGPVSLDRLLWDRSRTLPDEARQALDAVAVAGRPIPPELLREVVGAAGDSHATLSLLRARHLLRVTGVDALVTTYHDRVREAVLAHLPDRRRREWHLRWARVAEAAGEVDSEFLAVHFHRAGESLVAAKYYATAAAAASSVTAFNQAVRLYQAALELGAWPTEQAAALEAARAGALANAGQGLASAEAYLRAAAKDDAHALDWQRRAAAQYLFSGHIDVGLTVLREIAATIGMSMPRAEWVTIAKLFAAKARLWWRGIRFRPRPAGDIPHRVLERIDVCWSAGTSLCVTDYLLGAYFLNRGLLFALKAAEPVRVARFLALESAHVVVIGSAGRGRAQLLRDAATEIAAQFADPYLEALLNLSRGMGDYMTGAFRAALPSLTAAEQVFQTRCTGVTWELDTARTWTMWCLLALGEMKELAARWPRLKEDADDRGDLYARVNLGTYILSSVGTAADEPDQAWDDLHAVMANWSQRRFHIQHHNALLGRLQIHLYRGEYRAAWELVRDREPSYRRSLIWRIQQPRIDHIQFRARCALAAASGQKNPEPLLRSAERDARLLLKESAAWGRALGCLVQACVRRLRSPDSDPAAFADAVQQLEAADLGLFAASARYCQGERTPGRDGQNLRDEALRWLSDQGIRNPLRMIRSHAPAGHTEHD